MAQQQLVNCTSEFNIKSGNDISISVKRNHDSCHVCIQKGRAKLNLSLEEWMNVINHKDTVQLAALLLTGNLNLSPVESETVTG